MAETGIKADQMQPAWWPEPRKSSTCTCEEHTHTPQRTRENPAVSQIKAGAGGEFKGSFSAQLKVWVQYLVSVMLLAYEIHSPGGAR